MRPWACRSRVSCGRGYSGGSTSASAAFMSVLEVATANLYPSGMRAAKLHQFVVQQWHAAFERDRHAHLVGEHQQIVGQLGFGVHYHHAIQSVVAPGRPKSRFNGIVTFVTFSAQQLRRRRRRKHLHIGAVARLEALIRVAARKPLARRSALSSGEWRSLGSFAPNASAARRTQRGRRSNCAW